MGNQAVELVGFQSYLRRRTETFNHSLLHADTDLPWGSSTAIFDINPPIQDIEDNE
jgi:hypothetical protein